MWSHWESNPNEWLSVISESVQLSIIKHSVIWVLNVSNTLESGQWTVDYWTNQPTNQPTYHPLTGGQLQEWRPPETSWHWNKYIYGWVPSLKSGCKLNDIVFAWRSCSKRYVLALVAVRCAISWHLSFPPQLFLLTHPSIAFEHCLFTSSGRQQPHIDLIAVNCWIIYGTSRLRKLNLALIAAFVAAVDVNPLAWRLLELTLLGRALLLEGLSNPWLAQPAASLLHSQNEHQPVGMSMRKEDYKNWQPPIIHTTYIYTTWFRR